MKNIIYPAFCLVFLLFARLSSYAQEDIPKMDSCFNRLDTCSCKNLLMFYEQSFAKHPVSKGDFRETIDRNNRIQIIKNQIAVLIKLKKDELSKEAKPEEYQADLESLKQMRLLNGQALNDWITTESSGTFVPVKQLITKNLIGKSDQPIYSIVLELSIKLKQYDDRNIEYGAFYEHVDKMEQETKTKTFFPPDSSIFVNNASIRENSRGGSNTKVTSIVTTSNSITVTINVESDGYSQGGPWACFSGGGWYNGSVFATVRRNFISTMQTRLADQSSNKTFRFRPWHNTPKPSNLIKVGFSVKAYKIINNVVVRKEEDIVDDLNLESDFIKASILPDSSIVIRVLD